MDSRSMPAESGNEKCKKVGMVFVNALVCRKLVSLAWWLLAGRTNFPVVFCSKCPLGVVFVC